MRSFSFHDGIVGGAPRDVGIVHHQVDEERHQKCQDPRAVANLVAVDRAVPCCAAMHELVA